MTSPLEESESVVRRYIEAAKSYGEALKTGNHLKANGAHSVLRKTFQELSNLGRSALVMQLLKDENSAVRYSAAVDTLSISPLEAESALEGVVNGPPSPIRLMAQISLSEWRKQNSA